MSEPPVLTDPSAPPAPSGAHRTPGPLRPGRTGPFALTAVARGHLLALTGRLDVAAAADARLALAEALDDGDGDLVLDLGLLEAVDATGLGVLVGAHRRAGRSGRTLVLRDVPPSVGRLLHLTRLDRVLHQDGRPQDRPHHDGLHHDPPGHDRPAPGTAVRTVA